MKAAVLREFGAPLLDEFPDPVDRGEARVARVLAAGLNHLDLAKAGGGFYLGPPALPSVVGSDGVARLDDGTRVYFDECVAPFGALAELTLIEPEGTWPVPEGVDDATAAALGNAGIAAVFAVRRARVAAGDRVAVLGATGTVGSLATQLCRIRGAATVVAVGRDVDRLADLRHRFDAAPVRSVGEREALTEALEAAAGGAIDVIIDSVWGDPASAAMRAAAPGARLVQLGQRAAGTIELPAALLRSKRMELIGVSSALEPMAERAAAYQEIAGLAARGEIEVALERVPLDRVEEAWARQAGGPGSKLVVVP